MRKSEIDRIEGNGGNAWNLPTALSRFLSHISLIVHPAPRIISAPAPKSPRYVKGVDMGVSRAKAAIVIDQAVKIHTYR